MKKIIALLLALLMLTVLAAGCKTDPKDTTTDGTTVASEENFDTTTSSATNKASEETPATPDKLSETAAEAIINVIAPDAKRIVSSTAGKEIILTKQSSADAYIKAFVDEGYYDYPIDTVEGAKFTTNFLVGEKSTVAIYFHPTQKEVRIAWESVSFDYDTLLTKTAQTDTGTLQFAQIGTERMAEKDNPLNGMIYLIKLSDGRAILIDGGTGNSRNAQNIYDTLGKLDIAKDADGKYIIAAWIVTHAHGDHVGAPTLFIPKYKNQVKIENFIYNFTRSVNVIGTAADTINTFISAAKQACPDAGHIVAHANMKYYFGNATISMLYTPELLYSDTKALSYYNNSSLVFRIGVGDSAVFIMGDAANSAAGVLYNGYDASALTTDVLQITHHGLYTESNGHTWAFLENVYQAVAPELALLPMHSQYDGEARNGRYTVLKDWGASGYQISYVMNRRDLPDGMKLGNITQAIWDEFELSGTVNGQKVDTLLGYDGNNVITNADGLTTYMGGNRTSPMLVLLALDGETAKVIENKALYDWLT